MYVCVCVLVMPWVAIKAEVYNNTPEANMCLCSYLLLYVNMEDCTVDASAHIFLLSLLAVSVGL